MRSSQSNVRKRRPKTKKVFFEETDYESSNEEESLLANDKSEADLELPLDKDKIFEQFEEPRRLTRTQI